MPFSALVYINDSVYALDHNQLYIWYITELVYDLTMQHVNFL